MSKKLIDLVHNLFDSGLKKGGLNLDRNPRKKKALIDFLLTIINMINKCMTEDNIRKSFIKSGQIYEAMGMRPDY